MSVLTSEKLKRKKLKRKWLKKGKHLLLKKGITGGAALSLLKIVIEVEMANSIALKEYFQWQ